MDRLDLQVVIVYVGVYSYILMTHATAPRSARTLAQARPTMSCIHLVIVYVGVYSKTICTRAQAARYETCG